MPPFRYGIGDKKQLYSAAEGYGEKKRRGGNSFPKENVPADMKLEPGIAVNIEQSIWTTRSVVVIEVKDDVIMLDANHF